GRWGPDVLWCQGRGSLPAGRDLRGQDPEGCQTRRPACRAAHRVRIRGQPEDREDARPDDPAVGAGPGGRGGSVMNKWALDSSLIGPLLVAPLAIEAQPPGKVYRIGLLYGVTGFDPSADPTERALVDGLRGHGYVIGQNLVIELRSAYGKWERLPGLA